MVNIKSKVWMEDIDHLAYSIKEEPLLKGTTLLITGATGLIGSLLVQAVLRSNYKYHRNISLVLLVRDRKRAEEMFGDSDVCEDVFVVEGDVADQACIGRIEESGKKIDYLIHAASVTQSKEITLHPVETIRTIAMGTQNMLELCVSHPIRGMVFLSSMEIYGSLPFSEDKTGEDSYGRIDFLSSRGSYPEGKRLSECLCHAYSEEYQAPVKIARLAQTFGPGVSVRDNRVFMQFAKSAITSQDIILHTRGESMANYCYTVDCIRGLLRILLYGKNGEAYNVVNEAASMKIKEVAQLVADEISVKQIRVRIDAGAETAFYAPDTGLRLSGEKLRRLGWRPEYDLPEMFQRLVQDLIILEETGE